MKNEFDQCIQVTKERVQKYQKQNSDKNLVPSLFKELFGRKKPEKQSYDIIRKGILRRIFKSFPLCQESDKRNTPSESDMEMRIQNLSHGKLKTQNEKFPTVQAYAYYHFYDPKKKRKNPFHIEIELFYLIRLWNIFHRKCLREQSKSFAQSTVIPQSMDEFEESQVLVNEGKWLGNQEEICKNDQVWGIFYDDQESWQECKQN